MIFTTFFHKVSKVTIEWQSFATQKVCKLFSDKVSRIAEVNQEIVYNKNVPKHFKLLNYTSKFQNEIKYRKAGQKKTKGK